MSLPSWDGHASAPEQCQLLAALVRCQRPEVLVEAGTYRGHTAVHIWRVLNELRHGHLHTADPYPHGQMATLAGLDRVTFYQADFLDMLARLPAVDFAYIDASKPEKGGAALRWQHFEAVRARLRPGGLICVDDTAADDWDDGEGGRSVLRIRAACQLNFRFLRGLSVFYG